MRRNEGVKACVCVCANNRPLMHGGSLVHVYRGCPSYRFLSFAGNALVSRRFYRRVLHIGGFIPTVDLRNSRRTGSKHHKRNMCRGIVRTVRLLGTRGLPFNMSAYCASTGISDMDDRRFFSRVVSYNTLFM